MILLLENNIRGGISSVMGDRYVKSDENKKIIYMDATNLYDYPKSQPLPFDKIKFERNVCLKEILNTSDNSDLCFSLEVDLSFPLPLDKINFERTVCLKEILNTPDNSDICFSLEVDLSFPYNIRQKTKHFPFCPENKSISKDYLLF